MIDHFAPDGDLQALCDDIASTARLRRNDNHDDDITVAACRIQKSELGLPKKNRPVPKSGAGRFC